MAWSFACPDWVEKLQQGRTPIPDLPLDPVYSRIAVALYDKLRLPDVPGQPTMAEAAGEHVRDIVRAAFGSIDRATGERMVGEIFELIPKKNSKTTDAAALGLIALQMNTTPNIDGVIIGPTQEVADKCFTQTVGMINADPYLQKRFRVIEHKKTIIDLYKDEKTGVVRNAKLKIKSFDLKVVTGGIPAFAIIDELHVMSASPAASRIIAQIRGGMITNPLSLLIFITTQSDHPPAGAFKSELDYARGVRDGRITNHVRMLPILYEFPEAMQAGDDKLWRDPKYWPMVLPNLGRTIQLDRLIGEYATAAEKGVEDEAIWASQHLNIQIGLALHTDRWIGVDYWTGVSDETITLAEIIRRCDVATVGVDGGGLDDLFGLSICGRDKITGVWLFLFRAWAQTDALKRRKENAATMQDFVVEGTLTICPEDDMTRDFREAAELIAELNAAGLLPDEAAVGLDPMGVQDLVDMLLSKGLKPEQLVGVAQGVKLSRAIWGMERKLKDHRMCHDGSAMMNWVLGNARSEQRGAAIYISKQAAGKAKIDPLVAGFNAFELMSRNPEARGAIDDFLAHPVMVMSR